MEKKESVNEVIESLSSNERKILPFLNEKFVEVCKKAGLDEVAVLRALEFLSNKKLINLKITSKKIVGLGVNGVLYKQKGLPERQLINLISEKSPISLDESKKTSGLSSNEFQAALGALKKKALVNVSDGSINFSGNKEEIAKKTLEEQFIDALPLELEKLKPEQKYALENLKNRKNIVELAGKNEVEFELTSLGKEIQRKAEGIKEAELIKNT